jgi:hypothetical protein
MTEPEQPRPELTSDASLNEIEKDIERTRDELGDTVNALSHKLDVKGRVQDKAAETKDHVVDRARDTKAAAVHKASDAVAAVTDGRHAVRPIIALTAAVAAVAGIVIWQRRRRA